MSFTVSNNSSGTLRFRPAVWNVEWDGESESKVSFELACVNTNSTFQAVAFPVFTSQEIFQCPSDWTFIRGAYPGDRLFSVNQIGGLLQGCTQDFEPDVSLPLTVSSNIATIVFSQITNTTRIHSWTLKAVDGTSTRLVITGRWKVVKVNPWINKPGDITFVSNVTAHSPCA